MIIIMVIIINQITMILMATVTTIHTKTPEVALRSSVCNNNIFQNLFVNIMIITLWAEYQIL